MSAAALLVVVAAAVATIAGVRGMWSPCGLSMLSSLNPVSERARGHRFGTTAAWYVAGSAAGGAVLGLGLAVGAFGFGRVHASSSLVWGLVLAASVVAVASDTRVVGRSLPVHPRQVDERWLSAYRRWIYAGGYGVQIGTGFATYIMTAAVYLTAALAVLTGSPATAFAIGLGFGTLRGLGIAVCAGATSPEALRSLIARIDGWAEPSTWVASTVCAAAAATAGWGLGGPVPAVLVAAALGGAVAVSRRWTSGVVACPVPTD